ncbi:hypothetical protein [Chryseobacterium potabilaquae]|uniref:Uncharacterized protein n=1 Tax=Chryseobacterium potabilaquae TaxID=2675057 RepID=A0A6N4X7X1_9FLAO|nr:hypothetical protein [Chryseobacterium potabilaquae]CAA7197194.1 hypothetical protein CHRY9293_03248 [Chryseobacterium potabilaquae]
MVSKGNNGLDLELLQSQFESNKTYLFKFIINKVGWTTIPENALNPDKTEDNNLQFKID